MEDETLDCVDQFQENERRWMRGQAIDHNDIPLVAPIEEATKGIWDDDEQEELTEQSVRLRKECEAEKGFIRKAVAKLPHVERVIVELRYWKNIRASKAAQILQMSVSGVKKIEKRALNRLRRGFLKNFTSYKRKFERNLKTTRKIKKENNNAA